MRNERHYLYVHGSIPEFQDDGDDLDRYYLPARATSFAVNRSDTSVVIPDNEQTRVYLQQFSSIVHKLEMRAPNVVFIPDEHYFLDLAVANNLKLMETHLSGNCHTVVKPYANNQHLRRWVGGLRSVGHSVDIPMSERVYFGNLHHPQHRGGWSVRASESEKSSFAQRNGLPYPRSFWGIGLEEVLNARSEVLQGKDKVVYAKLMFSAGGFGVRKIQSEDDLIAFYGEVNETGALYLFDREQPFEIQEEIENIVGLASMQFSEGQITTPGGLALQHMNGGGEDSFNWAGNMFNAGYEKHLSREAISLGIKTAHEFKRETGDEIEGGMDLAIVRQPNGVGLKYIEPNLARSVGADPAIALGVALGVSDKPFLIRKTSNPNSDLATIWAALEKEGLAFDPQDKRGVFPLLWYKGTDAFFFVVGDDETDLYAMTDTVIDTKSQNGY